MARSPTRRPQRRTTLAIALGALSALAPWAARAETLPLRIDYEAAGACPGADRFVDEIRGRTTLARIAGPGDEALEIRVRIATRGPVSHGRLVLGRGRARVVREIEGDRCDEVVSALALVTALAVDPNASIAARPAPTPLHERPPAPTIVPRDVPQPLAPRMLADPLPVLVPAPAPTAAPWLIGARVVSDFGAAPRALFGGGIFAERPFAGRFHPSIRLALDVAATGRFDAGPGGASFVHVLGRVEACAFAVRPAARVSLTPCVDVQGGALYAEGILEGALRYVRQAAIPWVGVGFVPRVGVELGGPWALDVEGGPVFPTLRHTFVFRDPAYTIQNLPPVTWTLGLGLGRRFR